ncbi:activator of Hsp90 ATPase-like protein [Plasticicumulans lactativorans]|uniref:Activator of Hsp90 ATPase-like protein n=1 Tax=Plasticicumulans lactativorans TaxID=1133106 RepID=A0A4R2LLU6_9GAMM|nr:SRPBCC family protein [Plasticicumulans lactativorans]TCO80405.1 activator of Hsp90 ATPase-like protein [Plasticicumulans lactativorans]
MPEETRAADSEPTADREFVHARLIDAPRERVFRAFADPRHLARWWGPNGFSSRFEVFELRPGGRWRFVMHGPDGSDYPNASVFLDITAPERVVFEHLSEGHHFVMTITFTAQGDQTLVGWRQVFDTAAHRTRIAAFVLEANEQNLDRLAAEVRNVD